MIARQDADLVTTETPVPSSSWLTESSSRLRFLAWNLGGGSQMTSIRILIHLLPIRFTQRPPPRFQIEVEFPIHLHSGRIQRLLYHLHTDASSYSSRQPEKY